MNPLILIIRLYRMTLGIVFPPSCRFYPTCSDYAEQSITRHGILKGTYYSLLRILRCHPFHPGGYDPVK